MEQLEEKNKIEQTLKYFAKKGFLLDKETLEFFANFGDYQVSEEILNKLFIITKERVITKKHLVSHLEDFKEFLLNVNNDKQQKIDLFFGIPGNNIPKDEKKIIEIKVEKKPKKAVTNDVKILSSNIIPYKKITVVDFVSHFKNRYNLIKEILMGRKELNNLVSISKIGDNRNFSVICLVSNKRITKNKNIILEIEDSTGRISALISHDKEELFAKAKEIVLDDVIGLKCSGGKEIIYVNDIFFPESFIHEKLKADSEVYALFLSDIHIGSSLFLAKNFNKFIDWINAEGYDQSHKEKIKKIKYLFILGDNVDGVGVYPGQEAMLSIKDIKEQYIELNKFINKIPKHINIIMCPGQHDAVRVPEPQPPIDKDFAEDLTKVENLFLVSNPAMVEIECKDNRKGFKILMYHGASMHGWIDEIEDLRNGKANLNPSKVVKYMLKHRHLSPMHSSNVYVPSDKEDSLAIKEIPDIVATGDMHRTDVDMSNNILIICGSCWQSKTPFEEKVGNEPDPCKVPMLNLKTREIKILDFSDAPGDKT